MKPNHLIVLAFVLFIGFILTLVYKTFGVKDDLVAEDYYNQEIQYQSTIDQKNNAKTDSSDVFCTLSETEIILTFLTKNQPSTHVKGTASFMRPSDVAMDRSFPFESNTGNYRLKKNLLKEGLYLLKVQWTQNNTEYIKEQQLYIN